MSDAAVPHASTTAHRTRNLVPSALLAGLIAATSWIAVPLFGPVPVTLQTVFVLLAGLLLPPGWAAASMVVYLLLGAAGLPVFSAGQGGLGTVLGPTGGFLLAFPFAAAAASLSFRALSRGRSVLLAAIIAALIAEVVMYAIGLPWLMAQTGLSFGAAAMAAFVPFIVPDAIKLVFAVTIATAVRRALGR